MSYYLQCQLDVLTIPFAERFLYNGYLSISAVSAWCSDNSLCWTVPVQWISLTICSVSSMFWKFSLLNGSCTTDISYYLQCQLDVLTVPFAELFLYNGYLLISAVSAWCSGYLLISAVSAWCSESSLCWTVPVQRISLTICSVSSMFWKFSLLNGSCTSDISYYLQCQLDVLKVPFAERFLYNRYLLLSAVSVRCSESSFCWTVPVQQISLTICSVSSMFWKFPLLNGSCPTDISYYLQCQLDVSWNDSNVFFLKGITGIFITYSGSVRLDCVHRELSSGRCMNFVSGFCFHQQSV
jgi:lipid-A-disaccharide synthase-like uncharacterized protein